MSAAQWSVVLTGVGGALAWASFVARLLWQFRGKWDETNTELRDMQREIADGAKERGRIEQQLNRHLDWHDRQHAAGWFHRQLPAVRPVGPVLLPMPRARGAGENLTAFRVGCRVRV